MLRFVLACVLHGWLHASVSAGFALPAAARRKAVGPLFKATPEASSKTTPRNPRLNARQMRANLVAAARRRETYARAVRYMLYWGSSVDSIQAVMTNNYQKGWMSLVQEGSRSSNQGTSGMERYLPQVYSTLFYFARLRPRLLYSVGALLRALQVQKPG